MDSTPNELFNEWWEETHPDGTTSLEFDSDCDECVMPESFDDEDFI